MLSLLVFGLTYYFAAVLGVAGLAKLDQPTAFEETLRRYHLLPSWSVPAVTRAVPWLELALAVVLIAGIAVGVIALFVFMLFLLFFVLNTLWFLTRRAGNCGCYGGSNPRRVDGANVATASILALLAALHLWATIEAKPLGWQWHVPMWILYGGCGSWVGWRSWRRHQQRTACAIRLSAS